MLSNIGSLVLVGAGKMGMALVRGWLDQGLSAKNLFLVDPAPFAETINFANERSISLGASLPTTPPDVLVLAVKPQIISSVMAGLAGVLDADSLVLSIAAGVSLDQLTAGLDHQKVVRTMPNLPAQVGKGVTGFVPGVGVSAKDIALTKNLLSAVGLSVQVPDEQDLDALTALSGSGPAYVFLMVEAMAAAGVAHGLSAETAMVLARQTVVGAAALLDADPTDAGILRQNVTSPKGVTEAALKVLMGQNGLAELMEQAISAGRKRNLELGQ